MNKYLMFRLYGPIASWGDIAVGTHRPTFDHPSKSAVMGLLAAALGIRRGEDDKHREFTSSYNLAVIVNSSGVLLRDYHTSQVPSASSIKKRKDIATRRDELGVHKNDLNTILSTRDYYCDALYTVCLWSKNNTLPYSLELMKQKLAEPEFTLYLGRKSCPLAMPVQATISSGSSIRDAFSNAEFKDSDLVKWLTNETNTRVYWEGEDAELQAEHTITRRDSLLSRKRWQFADRNEHYTMVNWGNCKCI